jgi:hypothetical protein
MAFAKDQAFGDETSLAVKSNHVRKARKQPASSVVPILGKRLRFLARPFSVANLAILRFAGLNRCPAALCPIPPELLES